MPNECDQDEDNEDIKDETFFDEHATDSDEDEVEELPMICDQAPSPEAVRATASEHVKAQRRQPVYRPNRRTAWLLAILVTMLTSFLVIFFGFPHLWKQSHEAAGGTQSTPAPTLFLHTIEARLRSDIALRGGTEFDEVDSYQSDALLFLLEREHLFENRSTMKLQQIYALLCFYYATGGEKSWNSINQWLSGHDECSWPGVICDAQLNVKKLDLTESGLVGEIPNELVLLEHLEDLLLEDNSGLTGEIPSFLGGMDLSKQPFHCNMLHVLLDFLRNAVSVIFQEQ